MSSVPDMEGGLLARKAGQCDDGLGFHVLRSWVCPAPGDDPQKTRPKEYKILRLASGSLAFCKSDSAVEYLAHEGSILETLRGVDCVPALVCLTSTWLCTKYVSGSLLSEAISSLSGAACLSAGWQMVVAVARVHGQGVVHADIRPWNFIRGDEGRVYLIDFEYAYAIGAAPLTLLRVHHVSGLKTRTNDWLDTVRSIADLWLAATPPLVKYGLSGVALCAYWGLRLATLLPFLRASGHRPWEGLMPRPEGTRAGWTGAPGAGGNGRVAG